MGALDDKVVLVTGAGSGIGRKTAIEAAAAGARVMVTDITAHDKTAAEVEALGGQVMSADLDVRRAAAWDEVVAQVLANWGRLDGLANIAGVASDGPDTVVEQSEEGWHRVLSINLTGAWLGMRASVPHFLENGGGRVVNMSSVAGLIGMVNVAAYAASKGGLIGLTRQAAIEYAASNVNVNAICPGIIDTPILGDISQETYDACVAGTPVGRLGEPADIARMVVHLLGDGGAFITGSVITIDGGWTAR